MCERCTRRNMYMSASDKMTCLEVDAEGVIDGARIVALMALNAIYGRIACADKVSEEERTKAIKDVTAAIKETLDNLSDEAVAFMSDRNRDKPEVLSSISIH